MSLINMATQLCTSCFTGTRPLASEGSFLGSKSCHQREGLTSFGLAQVIEEKKSILTCGSDWVLLITVCKK